MQRNDRYVNHPLAEDHRGMKLWYRPIGESKLESNPARFLRTFERVRACLRPQSQRHPPCSRARRRYTQQDRLMSMLVAA